MLSGFIDKHIKWVFALPTLIFMVGMIAVPVLGTMGMSFTDYNLLNGKPAEFIGFENYRVMLTSRDFLNSVGITFSYTILTTFFQVLLGLVIAMILNKDFSGKTAVKTVVLLPYMMAPVAVGLMWTLFYEPTSGIINYLLGHIGVSRQNFLASKTMVIPAIAAVEIWQNTPMVMVICLAALAVIPGDFMEAARVDGANPVQAFAHVTLPILKPTLYSATLLRFIDTFRSFDLIYAMTQGGPANASRTLNLYSYELAFSYSKFGMSSTGLTLLFVIIMLVSLVIMRLQRMEASKL